MDFLNWTIIELLFLLFSSTIEGFDIDIGSEDEYEVDDFFVVKETCGKQSFIVSLIGASIKLE